MGLVGRLIRGTDGRKTRFHDLKGNRINLGGMRHLPWSVATTILRCMFGIHQRTPWLGFRARKHLERLIHPDWRILEFGSGMSTAWFASRCKEVVSVEHDEEWFNRVSREFHSRNIRNCDFRLVSSDPDACLGDRPDGSFDFALIDGIARLDCIKTALSKVRDNGWIYLDNSDFEPDAEALLLEHATASPRYFRDFVPGNVIATEGLLTQIGATNEAA